jgi:tRNA-binding EMAP/Myf-like protein
MIMGQSTLIGWYNPASKRFCYKDVKEAQPYEHEKYTQPVYAVIEKSMRKEHADEIERLEIALGKIENARTVSGAVDERLEVIMELKEIAKQALKGE